MWNQMCFKNKINNFSFNKTNNFLLILFKRVSDHAFMRVKTMTPWRPCHHVHLCVVA